MRTARIRRWSIPSGRPAARSRCCLFWWPRSFLAAFFVGYIPHHRRDLQIIAEANVQNDALPDVTVVAAKKASAMGELVLPGNIQAVTEAPILARADGYVQRRYVDIGDRVTAGQLLAEVEAPDLDQQVRQAQAAVEQAQADLARANAALEQGKANESIAKVTATRWDNLVRRGAVSKQENDQYQAQYQAQAANVKALERAVDAAKGNIAAMQANVGPVDRHAGISQGARALRRRGHAAQRRRGNAGQHGQHDAVSHRADQSSAHLLERAASPAPRMCMSARWRRWPRPELPERKFSGTVTRTANALDPASRTLLVEVQVPNPEGKLLPGMYVEVDLHLPRKDPPLLLPSDTLSVRPEGHHGGRCSIPTTSFTSSAWLSAAIMAARSRSCPGSSAGQRVIANPNDSVQEGVKVHPVLVARAPEADPNAPASSCSPLSLPYSERTRARSVSPAACLEPNYHHEKDQRRISLFAPARAGELPGGSCSTG